MEEMRAANAYFHVHIENSRFLSPIFGLSVNKREVHTWGMLRRECRKCNYYGHNMLEHFNYKLRPSPQIICNFFIIS